MAVDLQINPQTGDLEWSPIRDIGIAQGDPLIQQRINNRLMIVRGAFIYDLEGNLGSRLRTLLSLGVPQANSSISMIIQEALAPMTDVNILDVSTSITANTIQVTITYQSVTASASFEIPNSSPVATTTFVFGTPS